MSVPATRPTNESEYAELKRRIKANGLLRSQPTYYFLRFSVSLALFALAVAVVLTAGQTWTLLIGAAIAAFAFTQVGLLGHDLGHRQVLRRSRLRAPVSLLVGNLLIGVSYSWWVEKHNRHHAHPNDLNRDPDIDIAPFAFAPSQVESRPWLFRKIVPWQALYFWLILPVQGLNFRLQTAKHLLGKRSARLHAERIAFFTHIGLYALVLVAIGDWPLIIAFFVVHQGLFGLYNSLIFAPNHKGMPLIGPEDQLGFLREQVLTSRNVRGHWAVDFCYGGLNYQIEHHLFPAMPRNQLSRAQPIVKAFCAERGIPYCEEGLFESYREIVVSLHYAHRSRRAIPTTPELAPATVKLTRVAQRRK